MAAGARAGARVHAAFSVGHPGDHGRWDAVLTDAPGEGATPAAEWLRQERPAHELLRFWEAADRSLGAVWGRSVAHTALGLDGVTVRPRPYPAAPDVHIVGAPGAEVHHDPGALRRAKRRTVRRLVADVRRPGVHPKNAAILLAQLHNMMDDHA